MNVTRHIPPGVPGPSLSTEPMYRRGVDGLNFRGYKGLKLEWGQDDDQVRREYRIWLAGRWDGEKRLKGKT